MKIRDYKELETYRKTNNINTSLKPKHKQSTQGFSGHLSEIHHYPIESSEHVLNSDNSKLTAKGGRSLLSSFKFAWRGFTCALKRERNLRIHTLAGIFIVLLALLLKVSPLEIAILCLTIMLVIVCEIINTALELSLDFINGKKYHPVVRLVKDIVAAGVLLASLNAIIIGAIIFLKYLCRGDLLRW